MFDDDDLLDFLIYDEICNGSDYDPEPHANEYIYGNDDYNGISEEPDIDPIDPFDW